MYNKLLENVIGVINTTAKLSEPKQPERSDFYNMLFAPELYEEELRRARRQEEIKNKLILGATSLAVVGEVYHIAKSSGIVNKIIKR
jgi:hypothetical protein